MSMLGFDNTWIGWIMACVRSVTYSVLINGSPYGDINPTRGIRQGDPISPYLFLFCAEMLTQKIRQEEISKNIKGLSISNFGPRISHLLFADDSLFFCQANQRNCEALARTLNNYERVSGQQVNLNKSSITFGARVSETTQRMVKQVTKIHGVGGCGKYLGLPEEFTRKKVQMFEYIVKKVKERTQNWNNKFLSEAGKEVLLKSIALALPTYAMSCFKLPVTICQELDSILSQFWWGSKENHKRISWVGWKRLCFLKKEGDLGFKDLEKFNDSLLAKQAWRLLKHPDCLLAKVLKSRYYTDSDIQQARLGVKPSFGWRSILCGRDLLIRGLRYQVGSHSSINPVTDKWIPAHPLRVLSNFSGPHNSTIADLRTPNGCQWDPHKLSQWLSAEDEDIIKRIYIPQHYCEDQIIWHYTKDGNYSVKSGYWLSNHHPDINEASTAPPKGCPRLKTKIWKLTIPPKLKHFLWRVLSSALSSGSELSRRGIPVDSTCQRCHSHEESINHLLFGCPYAELTWELSNHSVRSSFDDTNSLEDNIAALLSSIDSSHSDDQQYLPFWIAWHIWKSRNDLIFNRISWEPESIIRKAKDDVIEWTSAMDNHHPGSQHPNRTATYRSGWTLRLQVGLRSMLMAALSDMRKEGIEPTRVTVSTCLSASANMGGIEERKQSHAIAIVNGLELDNILGTSILNFYCKVGLIEYAEMIFDRMIEKDVVTWNLLISGYVQQGLVEDAIHMCQLMRLENLKYDCVTLSTLMSAAARTQNLKLRKAVQCYSIRHSFESDIVLASTVVDMYTKCGSIVDAKKVFDSVVEKDLILWNTLLAAYAESGLSGEALRLFYEMQLESVPPNVITWNLIILSFLRNGQLNEAKDMFLQMQSSGIFPNLVSWTTMMNGLVQNGCSEEAIHFLRKMQESGLRPNAFSITVALSACSNLASLHFGRSVHRYIIRNQQHSSSVLIETSLVDMYAKCGDINKAEMVFRSKLCSELPLYNVMISAYALNGNVKEAIALYRSLEDMAIKPDYITFTSLLSACNHAGDINQAIEIFTDMVSKHGMKPCLEHYGLMVDLLASAGETDKALRLIEEMPYKPEARMIQSLVASCNMQHKTELMDYLSRHLLETEPENSGNYVTISNAYAVEGSWDEVVKMREMMKAKGLKKSPGCSWIRIKGEGVHVFVANDKTHLRNNEIQSILALLVYDMRSDSK